MIEDIEEFINDRNAALLSGDLKAVRAYLQKYSSRSPPMSDEVMEIAMHKARTGCRQLPLEARLLSKRWLTERGFQSADDGGST